ncbi:MAG: Efflux transporter, family, subunit [Pedosphaera sp.]|nr:Efflux transporter, family, subunit [Pedosphaera sp.]
MKINLPIRSIFFTLSILAAGCTPSNPAETKKETAPINVKLVQPHRGEITRSVTLPGNIIANQQAALYAKVGGYLKTITVDKGDAVKAGDLLAEIEVPELLADQAKYKAELAVAEIDNQRTIEAQQKAPDLILRQTLDTTRGRYEVAKANLDRAETLLGFCKISAPFSGVVTRRSVDPGAFIPAATSGSAAQTPALLTIMDFSMVRVQVSVPEPETPFIRNDVPVKVTVEELPSVVFPGTVTRYSHSLDETTKTMLTEIDIPNPKGQLLPGMYATIKLGVETRSDALLVPVEALVVEKSGTSVFTVLDNKARKVPVKTGFNDGASAEIVDGLKQTEPVILVGKQVLNNGQPVNVVETK